MLFDDYLLKQIQKIAQIAAAIAGRGSGPTDADLERDLSDAYRELLGMDRELAERMDASSLARLLGDPDRVRALVQLTQAHGDLCASREDRSGASRLYARAVALLEHADDPALRAALSERLQRG